MNERPRSRLRLALNVIALGLPLLVAVAVLASADVRYLLRAGYEEARILLKRRAIERLLADSRLLEPLRQQLRLVLEARSYAAESLGLTVGDTYTTYADVGRDTLLLVLSASRRDKLAEYTWQYPIVGVVPYKGFFDHGAARRAAAELDGEGYDVYLRPAGAFSTLGWFSDPLLSTALTSDTVELVAMVLHELAHNTLYVANATPFNESFANFVGYRGAEGFFRSRGDSLDARRAAARWRDERRLDLFYAELSRRLDSAYSEVPQREPGGPASLLEETRRTLFGWARRQLAGPTGQTLETYDWRWFATGPINNAVVIAARIYRTNLNLFDELYLANRAQLPETVRAIQLRVLTRAGEDPYRTLYSVSAPSD